jgi:predicted thioesterase
MNAIPIGVTGTYHLTVTQDHLANRFKDSTLPPVFTTPYLILVMENAALNAIRAYLGPDESAVGTRVDVKHLLATPVGRTVTGHAELTGVEGRRLSFRVWATDGAETIGEGTHERSIVTVSRIIDRMREKYGNSPSA